jgi:16S rRNA (adenine1518-N6/adenine1519-N6)-dimethyltransferase
VKGSPRFSIAAHPLARKRFGQHFLVDEAVVAAIVRAIAPRVDDQIVEIGPGRAALTRALLPYVERLVAVEIDRHLVEGLRQVFSSTQLQVVEADVLRVDFSQFGEKLRVVGNLPYNISSPILFHLLTMSDHICDQHFMLQREVVDRMVALPASSEYGRLAVMLQSRYRMEKLFNVPAAAFEPPPRVVSAVVRMVPLSSDRLQPQSEFAFAQVVARAFAQRRKMLRRALSVWADHIPWQALDIAPTARAEELSVDKFIRLADALWQAGCINREKPFI